MKYLFYFFCLAVLCPISCSRETEKTPTKEEIIAEKIKEKVMRWEQSMRRKCKEDVADQVEYIVDSTLIARARLGLDSIGKPLKPIKPARPAVKQPKDTFPVKPILDSLKKKF